MAIGTYISIITLNVNGLNAPTKRHRLAEWIQNKTHIYAVYKKAIWDLKTHIDWKWEDGKICSMHRGSKRKLEWISILISDKTDLKIKLQEIRKDTT